MMNEEQKLDVIDKVKSKLNITWNNAETERKLYGIVEDAEIYMNHILGAEIDYSALGHAHLLLKNYCLYMWNDCENEFETAYQKDILRARAYYEVKAYEAENTGTE